MTKCLWDYNIEELIRNKDIVLMRLRELEIELMKKEADLWLNTDFKSKGCTTDKLRGQYVKAHTIELNEAIKAHKHSIEVVNDLLRLRMKEIGGEN